MRSVGFFLSSPCVTHCLYLFRKQCQWAWSCSRAAGGSSSSWRGRRRTTIWPQESPGWKIQPHSWLNCSDLSPYIHSSLTPFFFREPLAIRLYHRNPIWCSTDSSILHIPKCIVLIPLSWKLFCTVFIVCLFLWMHFTYFELHNSKSFHVIRPASKKVQRSHVISADCKSFPKFYGDSTSCRW